MTKKKPFIYPEAMKEVARAINALEDFSKGAAGNPWGMYLEAKVRLDDVTMGVIKLDQDDHYVFYPRPEFFGEED